MIKRFKHHLTLPERTVAIILLIIFFVEAFFLVPTLVIYPRTNFLALILPAVLVDLTNQNRQSLAEDDLKTNSLLTKAAQLKAEDMAKKGYFAHRDPSGREPWYWLEKVGYRFRYAGENLAINFYDSLDVTNAWMKSPTHRANIVKKEFTEIGIGIARGKYQGQDSLFIVQFFGRPADYDYLRGGAQGDQVALVEGANLLPELERPVSGQLAAVGVWAGDWRVMFEKVLASPRAVASLVYVIIAIFVSLAIIASLINKNDMRSTIIKNGIILLIILGALIAFNQYLVSSRGQIAREIPPTIVS